MSLPNTCFLGHSLEKKIVTGSLFGIGMKRCVSCNVDLKPGVPRHSCKPCNFHLCEPCWRARCPDPPRAAPSVVTRDPLRRSGSLGRTSVTSDGEGARRSRSGSMVLCKWGAACYNRDPEHRRRYAHPDGGEGCAHMREACKFGSKCYRKNADHLAQFVHPGDRNYRIGLVRFDDNTNPEFESLWQIFQFHDPDESGHISKEEFKELLRTCRNFNPGALTADLDQAWQDAGGPVQDHLNFRQFVTWWQDFLHVELPLGLEDSTSSTSRPCRFSFGSESRRCSCPCYRPVADTGRDICECGHKLSMHRSEFAERTLSKFLQDATDSRWTPGIEGLVKVEDPVLHEQLQDLLIKTHKTTDNWTRDRGCKSHGVNKCSAACASKNRVPVPSGYFLHTAYRNQNADLWQKYCLVKTAITEECARPCEVSAEAVSVETSDFGVELQANTACNEWFLFHGSSPAKCKSICATNFKLALAGSGATWKDAGSDKGTPLYGFGIYLAERVTKADEYSEPIPQDDPVLPSGEDLYTLLLCRVVGGRTNVVTTNEIEREKLRHDVFDGCYHSVLGDRVSSLGKPYREVVVYDKDQCYPEFLLVYARSYD